MEADLVEAVAQPFSGGEVMGWKKREKSLIKPSKMVLLPDSKDCHACDGWIEIAVGGDPSRPVIVHSYPQCDWFADTSVRQIIAWAAWHPSENLKTETE